MIKNWEYLLDRLKPFWYVKNGMKSLKEEIQQSKPFYSIEHEVYLNLLKTSDMLRLEIEKILQIMGLNHNKYNVLRILRGSEPIGLRNEEIYERMVTKEKEFNKLLEVLESRGLISFKQTNKYPQKNIARITNQGLDVLAALDLSIFEKTQNLLSFLGQDLLEQLNTLLVLARKNTE